MMQDKACGLFGKVISSSLYYKKKKHAVHLIKVPYWVTFMRFFQCKRTQLERNSLLVGQSSALKSLSCYPQQSLLYNTKQMLLQCSLGLRPQKRYSDSITIMSSLKILVLLLKPFTT